MHPGRPGTPHPGCARVPCDTRRRRRWLRCAAPGCVLSVPRSTGRRARIRRHGTTRWPDAAHGCDPERRPGSRRCPALLGWSVSPSARHEGRTPAGASSAAGSAALRRGTPVRTTRRTARRGAAESGCLGAGRPRATTQTPATHGRSMCCPRLVAGTDDLTPSSSSSASRVPILRRSGRRDDARLAYPRRSPAHLLTGRLLS